MIPFLAVVVAVAAAELDLSARRAVSAGAALVVGGVAGVSSLVVGTGRPAAVTVAVVAGMASATAGGMVDARSERQLGLPPWPSRLGTTILAVVVAAAILLFGYFPPLWYAWPLSEDALQARWWFPGWV